MPLVLLRCSHESCNLEAVNQTFALARKRRAEPVLLKKLSLVPVLDRPPRALEEELMLVIGGVAAWCLKAFRL